MKRSLEPVASATVRIAFAALVLAGCSGPLLANGVPSPTPLPGGHPSPEPPADPVALAIPADDGPHDRLTEWWYYTGHLEAADARRFGFEFVIFRAERGSFPVAWAAHLALTDEVGQRFVYDQRAQVGDQVDRSRPGQGFDLAVSGDIVPGVRGAAEPWTMTGASGHDRLVARGGRSADGTELGIVLELEDGSREPLLHDGDGWVDLGPSGGSYYVSRPRMTATGSVTLDGETIGVTGTAWFDHQWGDFISVGGGWDWFAVNLDDGTDLTISVVRDATGADALAYGTISDATGPRHLAADDVSVVELDRWTSPTTGITWPAGWRISVPGDALLVELAPTLPDQELDTRETTGVIYWEGSQIVTATREGQPLAGEAYVELTGYAATGAAAGGG